MRYITPGGMIYPAYAELARCNHLLIAGATGSGKSCVINGIMHFLLSACSPGKAQFVLIDPKKIELSCYERLPHTVRYASEPEQIINALDYAMTETQRRFSRMRAAGVKMFSGPDLYIIIDELADLMVSMRKETLPTLQRIAQIGRAARVHVIACSQNVMAVTIPTVLRCNFTSILGLRTATKSQSRFLISGTGCELLPDPRKAGTSFGYFRDGADLKKVEFYLFPDAEISRLVNYWTSSDCMIA